MGLHAQPVWIHSGCACVEVKPWLGLVQPVGLVMAPAVLTKLKLFPNPGAAYLSSSQRQLKSRLEERDHSATGKLIMHCRQWIGRERPFLAG